MVVVFFSLFCVPLNILLIRFYSNDRHHLIPTVQITLIYLLLFDCLELYTEKHWNAGLLKLFHTQVKHKHIDTGVHTGTHQHTPHLLLLLLLTAIWNCMAYKNRKSRKQRVNESTIVEDTHRTNCQVVHTQLTLYVCVCVRESAWMSEWASERTNRGDHSMRVHSMSKVIVWMGFSIMNMSTNIHAFRCEQLATKPPHRNFSYSLKIRTFCEYFRVRFGVVRCCSEITLA